MCFFSAPKIQTPDTPKKENVTSTEDMSAITAEQEKRRKGYSSTIATSGSGLMDPAMIKKVTLGS